MYIPDHFNETNPDHLREVMRQHDFATVMTAQDTPDGLPMISHIPLVLEGEDRLIGHTARSNPHWRLFENGRPTRAIFHGPHGYVSPRWYVSDKLVPTWNYVVVHATGSARVMTDEEECLKAMEKLVAIYETGEEGWRMNRLSERAITGLLRGIVPFEIRIEQLEGKFKLSQNRSAEDKDGVIRHLGNSVNSTDRDLAAWMADIQEESAD